MNGTAVPFKYFFGTAGSGRRYDARPNHLLREPETLTVGGTRFVLYPARGGETADALLIHVPDRGVLFVGECRKLPRHTRSGLNSYQVAATSPGRRHRDGSPFSSLRG